VGPDGPCRLCTNGGDGAVFVMVVVGHDAVLVFDVVSGGIGEGKVWSAGRREAQWQESDYNVCSDVHRAALTCPAYS